MFPIVAALAAWVLLTTQGGAGLATLEALPVVVAGLMALAWAWPTRPVAGAGRSYSRS